MMWGWSQSAFGMRFLFETGLLMERLWFQKVTSFYVTNHLNVAKSPATCPSGLSSAWNIIFLIRWNNRFGNAMISPLVLLVKIVAASGLLFPASSSEIPNRITLKCRIEMRRNPRLKNEMITYLVLLSKSVAWGSLLFPLLKFRNPKSYDFESQFFTRGEAPNLEMKSCLCSCCFSNSLLLPDCCFLHRVRKSQIV